MRTVQSVERRDVGLSDPLWVVTFKDDFNTTGLSAHGFPDHTLDWRAAEYGIALEDAETLLDVVLHEPFISVHPDDPTFVFNTDADTARRAHLARVAKIRSGHPLEDPEGLLRQIHDHHRARMSHDDHQVKKSAVDDIRAAVALSRKEPHRG